MKDLLTLWLIAGSATVAAASPWPAVPHEETGQEELTEPALRSELLALRERDQELRSAMIESPEDVAILEELRAFDERATARAKEILAKHGWPSIEEVGPDGSGALWLLIQHATDPDFLAAAVPLMEQAAERGDLDRASVALSVDRVRTNRGEPQLYGTQFREVDGELVPHPIEDESRLDERRERMGLPPFEEYRRLLLEVYGRAPKEEEEPGPGKGGGADPTVDLPAPFGPARATRSGEGSRGAMP